MGKTTGEKDNISGESHDTNGHPDTYTDAIPWWTRTGLIAVGTAIIAAVAPVTTGINGLFQLKVQQEKNRFDMRDKYLERAIDKNLGPEERERLFEFLIAVFNDDPLRDWAQDQLDDATAELKRRLALTAAERDRVTKELRIKQVENETLTLDKAALQGELAQVKANIRAVDQISEAPDSLIVVDINSLSPVFKNVFTKAADAVLRMESDTSYLSGFFVSSKGHIISAAHGFGGTDAIGEDFSATTGSGLNLKVKLISLDVDLDLALLKAEIAPPAFLQTSPLPIARTDAVMVMGYVDGMKLTPAQGIVSSVYDIAIRYQRENIPMTGISGAPVLNAAGGVVGVQQASWAVSPDERMAEAINAGQIQKILNESLEN